MNPFTSLTTILSRAAFATVFAVPVFAQGPGPIPDLVLHYADTIVTNGRIVTMDNKDILSNNPGSIVEAMAIRDGNILATGSNQDMLRLAGPGSRIIDVKGKTVIPGIIETHVHPEATMSSIEEYARVRDPYQWAPGLHTAIQVEQDAGVTLDKLRQVLQKHPLAAGEWLHVRLISNQNTDYPDIGAMTNAFYKDFITLDDLSAVAPNNPATLGSGAGPSVVQQPGLVVRIRVGADRKSVTEVLAKPDPSQEILHEEGSINPFMELFRHNAALDREEELHTHMAQGCGWAEPYPHHLQHCSHRLIMLNRKGLDETTRVWPGFIQAANEIMNLTERAGERGLVGGVLQDSGGWEKAMFPNRTPRDLYTELAKAALLHYAAAGVTMIASSLEDGQSVTAYYDIIRRDGRLPVRFGYGYEMFRDPRLYPVQTQLVTMLGAHQASPKVNPWFWPMGITDGGAGDSRRVACFGEDLPGPEMLKDRELCMTGDDYRFQRTLMPAIMAGWRAFSLHSFGSHAFRLHAEWIEEARIEGGMSVDDIRNLRIGFAHGGAIGKIPDVIETMKKYNFYVPIQPNDVAASLDQVRRYGPEGLEFLAPTRTLLEAGVKVVGETEYSEMHPAIYFNAFDMFVNRRIRGAGSAVETGEIVMPEEAVSRATALRLYTSRAAEWLFAEDYAGSLEPGKWADFAVLDQDYFSVPADQLLDNKVIMTVVGDLIVYQDPDWQPGISSR